VSLVTRAFPVYIQGSARLKICVLYNNCGYYKHDITVLGKRNKNYSHNISARG